MLNDYSRSKIIERASGKRMLKKLLKNAGLSIHYLVSVLGTTMLTATEYRKVVCTLFM